jgi:hypothetical protein
VVRIPLSDGPFCRTPRALRSPLLLSLFFFLFPQYRYHVGLLRQSPTLRLRPTSAHTRGWITVVWAPLCSRHPDLLRTPFATLTCGPSPSGSSPTLDRSTAATNQAENSGSPGWMPPCGLRLCHYKSRTRPGQLHHSSSREEHLHREPWRQTKRRGREIVGLPPLSTHMLGATQAHLSPVWCLPQSVARARCFVGAWGARSTWDFSPELVVNATSWAGLVINVFFGTAPQSRSLWSSHCVARFCGGVGELGHLLTMCGNGRHRYLVLEQGIGDVVLAVGSLIIGQD